VLVILSVASDEVVSYGIKGNTHTVGEFAVSTFGTEELHRVGVIYDRCFLSHFSPTCIVDDFFGLKALTGLAVGTMLTNASKTRSGELDVSHVLKDTAVFTFDIHA
jgi:hypothetical protein